MNIIVLEDFILEKPNTKSYSDFLSNFNLLDNKTVLVVSEPNKNIFLSSRNLKKASVVTASELNTYDVLLWAKNDNHSIMDQQKDGSGNLRILLKP